jgi:DNA-binding protein H-NS
MSAESYEQIVAQIAELQKKAEVLREQQLAEVIATIKSQIAEFKLTAKDLGFSLGVQENENGTTTKKPRRKVPVKYRGPNGEPWTGVGRAPKWAQAAKEAGNLEQYLIAPAA